MKKIFIIYGHYNDKSFTCAIKDVFIESAKENGHEIDLVDLYKDKFNPVFAGEKASEEIKNYQSRIEKADVIVFIYPIWWFRAPAVIEGFIDSSNTELNGLDILVNNAGITQDNLSLRMKDDEWNKVVHINLSSTFLLCKFFAEVVCA